MEQDQSDSPPSQESFLTGSVPTLQTENIQYKINHWVYVVNYVVTVKPVLSGHSKRTPKIGFQDRLSLKAGQKYCRMLKWEHLQYF